MGRLQLVDKLQVFVVVEGYYCAALSSTASPARAMQIIADRPWEVVVDDVLQEGKVESSRAKVSAEQHITCPSAEPMDISLSAWTWKVTVKRHRFDLTFVEEIFKLVQARHRIAEHHHSALFAEHHLRVQRLVSVGFCAMHKLVFDMLQVEMSVLIDYLSQGKLFAWPHLHGVLPFQHLQFFDAVEIGITLVPAEAVTEEAVYRFRKGCAYKQYLRRLLTVVLSFQLSLLDCLDVLLQLLRKAGVNESIQFVDDEVTESAQKQMLSVLVDSVKSRDQHVHTLHYATLTLSSSSFSCLNPNPPVSPTTLILQ